MTSMLRMMGVWGGLVLVWWSVVHCVLPSQEPGVCSHGYECGAGMSCVFDKPECYANLGTCEGRCKATQEALPEKTCACKDDADCNYPYEGCGNCVCYKRDIRTCQSDSDCGRGWICTGSGSVRVCELRKACTQDNDCLAGYLCREQACCNPNAGNCSATSSCQIGMPCTKASDCSACSLLCEMGRCQKIAGDACQSKVCQSNADCLSCNGACTSGVCRVQSQGPTCQTLACVLESDCQNRGYTSCVAGCCR